MVADGQVWRFDRTHWVPLDEGQLARLIHKADGVNYPDADGKPRTVRLNKARVGSITDTIMKYRQQPDFFAVAPLGVNCASGFIRFADDGKAVIVPHARRWRQRHVVKGRYPAAVTDEQRADSKLTRYLRETFTDDEDAIAKRELLAEMLGAAAMAYGTRVRSPKAIVAYSEEGATGKSVLLELLRALPNPEAVSSVPPGKFGDEKYAYRLIGKVLNASDELPDRSVRSDVFKRMITGEPVPARDVYRSATDFRPIALHVFSTNVLPNFQGGVDGGLLRRLLPVPFNRVVPEHERNPDLARTIVEEEADLLLELAVTGAIRLLNCRDFTVPQSSRKLLSRWALWADPVRAWAAERLEVTAEENRIAVASLYNDFAQWAQAGGLKTEFLPNAIGFGKRLKGVWPELEYHRADGSFYRNARIRMTPESTP
jgi:P4 family phage/plasmid primase-like protien